MDAVEASHDLNLLKKRRSQHFEVGFVVFVLSEKRKEVIHLNQLK